jgi:hypothetical protein
MRRIVSLEKEKIVVLERIQSLGNVIRGSADGHHYSIGWQDTNGTECPRFAHAFVAETTSAETMEVLLRRLGIPDPQVKPLITAIRTGGWRSL